MESVLGFSGSDHFFCEIISGGEVKWVRGSAEEVALAVGGPLVGDSDQVILVGSGVACSTEEVIVEGL